jgi:hypothetical protein
MKRGIICTLVILGVSLILVAGCTTLPSGSTTASGISGGASAVSATGHPVLTQYETAVLVNGTYAINASVEQITPGRSQSGNHEVDIYIDAKNTGTTPVQMRWFSRITDSQGVSFGGVGISHNGSGAETAILMPGVSDTPRDYVVIDSDKDYAALASGATLEVFFATEPLTNQNPVEFSAAWTLNPAVFT